MIKSYPGLSVRLRRVLGSAAPVLPGARGSGRPGSVGLRCSRYRHGYGRDAGQVHGVRQKLRRRTVRRRLARRKRVIGGSVAGETQTGEEEEDEVVGEEKVGEEEEEEEP